MARSKSSNNWLKEHVNDSYVQMAQKDGYRARAAYKLLDINDKDKLIIPGIVLADLGSAPGSWSQVAARIVGDKGKVFALDILPMDPVPGVVFIQGDFREEEVLQQFVHQLEGRELDLVISDMAPNISGLSAMDQARSFLLCELALEFVRDYLKPGGHFLVKVFQGSDFQRYLQSMRELFDEVVSRKPKASRDRSSEVYLLGKRRR
ncbi:RlmE family RNA methyltransferase [Neisseriaceae bacterium TC5R-5]|nr:RlmE family RNA methyltransferase [Neisseriaceae bacterium TC5R-5]